jgi:hypothetical protein
MLLLMQSVPAQAHCYSRWYYPSTDWHGHRRCSPLPSPRIWYVEITKLPPGDDLGRNEGIVKLREMMK